MTMVYAMHISIFKHELMLWNVELVTMNIDSIDWLKY